VLAVEEELESKGMDAEPDNIETDEDTVEPTVPRGADGAGLLTWRLSGDEP
jgi:hypothetical protein